MFKNVLADPYKCTSQKKLQNYLIAMPLLAPGSFNKIQFSASTYGNDDNTIEEKRRNFSGTYSYLELEAVKHTNMYSVKSFVWLVKFRLMSSCTWMR